AAYSDQSTCADWAGGDGVSAVRLSSTQLAWFFSDTFLGPAGPSIGFSHASGFVHNSVAVPTSSGQRSRIVTLTGGDACSKPGESSQAAIPVISGPIQAGQEGDRYWDADGLRIGRDVIKFFNRYLPGSPPFVPVGTVIAQFSAGQLAAAGRGPGY